MPNAGVSTMYGSEIGPLKCKVLPVCVSTEAANSKISHLFRIRPGLGRVFLLAFALSTQVSHGLPGLRIGPTDPSIEINKGAGAAAHAADASSTRVSCHFQCITGTHLLPSFSDAFASPRNVFSLGQDFQLQRCEPCDALYSSDGFLWCAELCWVKENH
jgi:hypothetical protein